MKLKSTIEEIKILNLSIFVTNHNTENYESVAKYFDFQKAVRAVLWSQNKMSKN